MNDQEAIDLLRSIRAALWLIAALMVLGAAAVLASI